LQTCLILCPSKLAYRLLDVPIGHGRHRLGGRPPWQQGIDHNGGDDHGKHKKDGDSHA
jgi:hypothetical protein